MCTCVYGVLALVSHLSHFARRTTWQVCRGCTSEQLYCSWAHPEGNNTHLRLLHQEAGRQCCTAACGGVEVPCLLTFYHWDTRVLGKAKELVTRSLYCPTKLASQTLKCYRNGRGSLLWTLLSSHDWQESLIQRSTHQKRHRLCILKRKGDFQQAISPWGKVVQGCNKWQLKALFLLDK